MRCYCDSGQNFTACCEPLLRGEVSASNAQALMRSRYSAFVTKNWHYIWQTYGQEQRAQFSPDELANDDDNCQWLGLTVERFSEHSDNTATVQFIACYRLKRDFFRLHECSQFEKQQGKWVYTAGQLLDDSGQVKLGRNDPCLCQSGKKFKQCCGRN